MKFTIDRDQLLNALQKVQSVVEKKNTVQILANILCHVKDGRLELQATDLEVGVKVTLPVQASQDGRITLSAKNFLDIVKELPSKPLEISRKNNDWIELVCGKSKFNVVSLSADEYPALPNYEEKEYFQAKVATLSDMVNKTSFAVSTDATRYNLSGVFFEPLENNLMRMTATDGHRLSFIDQEVFLKAPEMKRGMIIPKKGLGELKKMLDEGGETIGLAFDRGYIFAHLNDTYLFVRLIEGEYPDYKQVIPKAVDRSAFVDREALTAAVRRVSLLAHEKSRGIKFAVENGMMVITSSNPDMGEAREELDIEYKGEPVEIGFNAKYLLDCLPVLQSSKVEFKFKDRLNPGVFQGAEQKSHTYIVMPMRI
ncbi:MAG: DNA polymerase III subunit beta [Bacteriovoracia bacterium]